MKTPLPSLAPGFLLALLATAVPLSAQSALGLSHRAAQKMAAGDSDGAVADYSKSIRLDATQAFAYLNRGLAKSVKRDFAGAIADYDQAIKLEPANASL